MREYRNGGRTMSGLIESDSYVTRRIITMLLIFSIIFILVILVVQLPKELADKKIYDKCCDGKVCTDTYYTIEDNLCHLVLCEKNIFGSNCTYNGKLEDANVSEEEQ